MKTASIVVLFLLVSLTTIRAENGLVALRKQLDACRSNREHIDTFKQQLESTTFASQALKLGYLSMKEMLISKNLSNPLHKLEHFKSGRNYLEKAIQLDPTSPELIFFRYATQTSAPAILGYGQNLKQDKNFLMNYIITEKDNINRDLDLYSRIKTYLYTSDHTSEAEKQRIKQL